MEDRIGAHAARPVPLHDEAARQEFVVSLRQYSGRVLGAGNYHVYKARVEPGFVKAKGRGPKSGIELREAMTSDPFYQFWSATHRNSQEMIWDSVIDTVERTLPEIVAQAAAPQPLGSLRLDPDLPIPRYNSVYDIHLQPGGYHTDQCENDISAGAIYDLGVPIYSLQRMNTNTNANGVTMVNYFKSRYPDLKPLRILDLGCTIGNTTLPFAQSYPGAEIHGVDLAAPCLRYAHARANALGQEIHWSQQNAEALDFPDGHFDIVVSTLLFHETSRRATLNIFSEIARVLKPGGVTAHFDGFHSRDDEPIIEFLGLWEVDNNNEKFLLTLKTMDVIEINTSNGLENVRFDQTPFLTGLPEVTSKGKGYMAGGGFGDIDVLVGEKPL
jgi:ubiquinone/menaquinone biosynthesis C-methylase UbiE